MRVVMRLGLALVLFVVSFYVIGRLAWHWVEWNLHTGSQDLFGIVLVIWTAAASLVLAVKLIPPEYSEPKGGGVIDQKLWVFDAQSGQYFRILGRHKGRALYNQEDTYERRFVNQAIYTRNFHIALWTTIVGITALIVIYIYQQEQWLWHRNNFLLNDGFIYVGFPYMLAGSASLAGIFTMLNYGIKYARHPLGPPPVPPPGREEVMKEKAYGDATVASLSDIHKALGGAAGGSSRGPAPQEPMFDE